MVDKKFYMENENLRCPYCKSDEIIILGGNSDIGTIVKCQSCGKITMEDDLEEKEEDEKQNSNL